MPFAIMEQDKGNSVKYLLVKDDETGWGMYDKPLRCYGCGIGWFCWFRPCLCCTHPVYSFLIGVLCPLVWYYATYLYFSNHYRKDPRERAGLAASAIAALICSAVAVITILAVLI